jgi:hypothetical protein
MVEVVGIDGELYGDKEFRHYGIDALHLLCKAATMKAITVRLSEDEYEKLRFEAYEARESVGRRAGVLLGKELMKLGKAEVRQRTGEVLRHAVTDSPSQGVKDALPKKGVEVSLMEPVNTVEEATRRAAELKRLQAARKDMEKRYGAK